MIGSTIAHYRITAKLGEGGMGEVYRAVDDRLNRDVAIKLLPESVEQDPARLARFRREAQVLASLAHGNIAQVYGLEEEGGKHAIVLELVEGEDLSERIARGALPLDDAREIALQIATALEAAHEAGVIHRDLKPANIKIGDRPVGLSPGDVKVLDFGLAKALEADPASSSGVNLTASPTVTSAQTRDGVILGTAAYMSPEQARGKVVDKRADIWAFGCVLYEMLTGKTTFAAETISDTLVAVLSGEPDWAALPATTPVSIRRLLERCLTRDARRRLRDIGEARVVLEDAASGEAEPVETAAGVTVERGLSPLHWALLAVAGLVLFAAGWWFGTSREPAQIADPERSIVRLTFEEGLEQEPSLSPDGNYVAYSTDREGNLDIEILPLGGGSVNRITDHAADDAQPRWSPDGTKLAFVSARDRESGLLVSSGGLGADSIYVSSEGGDIFVIPAHGGTPTKLIDRGAYPSWSPDGTAIAFQSNRDGEWRIWRVSVTGDEPLQLTSGEPGRFDFHPAWSPDGRWIAYAVHSPVSESGLFVVPAEGGEPVRLTEGSAISPAWSADGKSLYFSSNRTASEGVLNLWRIPFDPGAGSSPPLQRLTLGTWGDVGVSPSADDRRLAYANVQFAADLWSLEVASRELRQVTSTDGIEDYPHLNPDGRRLLFESNRGGAKGLWVKDLRSGDLEPFPTPGSAGLARWSPDGTRAAYAADGESGIAIQRWGEATRETLGAESDGAATGLQWSPDGTRLVGSNAVDLWIHTPGESSRLLIENAAFGTWSPDGSEIAYQRNAGSDHREIWAIPSDGGEPRMIVGGAVHYSHPQWHPTDADRILFVIDHKDLGILHVGSGEVERITELASSTVLVDYPSWSPDGTTVYFSIARMRGDLFLIEQELPAP